MIFNREELHRLRKLRGFTQLTTAKRLNISEKLYQQKEFGYKAFKENEIGLLAQLFKVEIGAFYTKPEDAAPHVKEA